jgi:hypothetical protein
LKDELSIVRFHTDRAHFDLDGSHNEAEAIANAAKALDVDAVIIGGARLLHAILRWPLNLAKLMDCA